MSTRRERLERKLEKREEWSDKARARADSRFGAASSIADRIPFGQPILVGHHSERRARRDQARIHSNMDKGVEESKLASHHASKADGIERMLDRSIFDDDPDAIEQLEARIVEREKSAEREKAINKAWKKGGAAGLLASGLVSAAFVERTAKTMALCPWLRSPMSTTGTRAAIRKDRERITFILAKRARAEKAEAAGGILIEGEAWVRVTFPEKPPRDVLVALRAAGFYWGGGSWGGERAKLPPIVLEMVTPASAPIAEPDDLAADDLRDGTWTPVPAGTETNEHRNLCPCACTCGEACDEKTCPCADCAGWRANQIAAWGSVPS